MENSINKLDFKTIFKETFSLKKYDKINKNDCTSNSGIYFLHINSFISYIGISQNISDRLFFGREPHIYNKFFTHFSYVEIKKDNYDLQKLERILINFFNPIDNSSQRNQLYLSELPKDYADKIYNFELKKAQKIGEEMAKYF